MQQQYQHKEVTGNSPSFAEPMKLVPVAFVVVLICILYSIYVFVHCTWMLQDKGRRYRAYVQLLVFHILTLLLVTCYVRSIITSPGEIPDDDEWVYCPRDLKSLKSREDDRASSLDTREVKRSGDRRHCKWCRKYKPDRCHHCRACQICVLKMDHHCPWINNCVGFRNHKYFFLLVLYCSADCHVIAWSMLESVRGSLAFETPFIKLFFVLFGFILSGFIAIVATAFLGFHIWLAGRGMTTIEFCEKSRTSEEYKSPYDEDTLKNAKAILGQNVLLWLLPLSPPTGDGMTFLSERSRLTADPNVGKKYVQRKCHTPTQRDTPRDSGGILASAAETSQQQFHRTPHQETGESWAPAAETLQQQFHRPTQFQQGWLLAPDTRQQQFQSPPQRATGESWLLRSGEPHPGEDWSSAAQSPPQQFIDRRGLGTSSFDAEIEAFASVIGKRT